LLEQTWPGSTVLVDVAVDIRQRFLRQLERDWLPDRSFELLYRGSRDGMTPAVFHDKCDWQGPTIVLVKGQSEGRPVSVFGGYAGASWELDRGYSDARDSFVFSVVNPFGDGIFKLGVLPGSEMSNQVFLRSSGCGPCFGGGKGMIKLNAKSSTDNFDATSHCDPLNVDTFDNPFLSRGRKLFTGAYYFQPLEVEVWRVYAREEDEIRKAAEAAAFQACEVSVCMFSGKDKP
jgi:TLD